MLLAVVFSSIPSLLSFLLSLPLAVSDGLCPPCFSVLGGVSLVLDLFPEKQPINFSFAPPFLLLLSLCSFPASLT